MVFQKVFVAVLLSVLMVAVYAADGDAAVDPVNAADGSQISGRSYGVPFGGYYGYAPYYGYGYGYPAYGYGYGYPYGYGYGHGYGKGYYPYYG